MVIRGLAAAIGMLVATATDAMVWQVAELPPGDLTIVDVTAGDDGFLAAALDTDLNFLWSADGASWSEVGQIDLGPAMGRLARGSGVYVFVSPVGSHACGDPNCIWVSTTGAQWTRLDFDAPVRDVLQIAYWNGRFVALGRPVESEGSQPYVLVSENGFEWHSALELEPGAPFAGELELAGGVFFIGAGLPSGPDGYYRSTDGVNWDYYSVQCSIGDGVAYGSAFYLTKAYDPNSFCKSPDGINWTVVPQVEGIFWHGALTFVEGFFYSAGGGRVTSSPDGLVWQEALPDNALSPRQGFAANEGNFIAFGDNAIWHGDLEHLFESGFGNRWAGD